MMSLGRFLSLSLLLLSWVQVSSGYKQTTRPNIIIFLVDDLGWNDVGYNGETEIPTPNIDALAHNGVILSNYYTYPVCTPSRSALLSGRLPTSTGTQHFVLLGAQPTSLPLNFQILPQFLNYLGYESHMIGKWHLGFHKEEYTPIRRGFKTHYGFWPGMCDFHSHLSTEQWSRTQYAWLPCNDTAEKITFSGMSLRDNLEKVIRPDEYLTDLLTERSVDVILNHDPKKPLFLYLSHHGVHRGNFLLPIRGPEKLTKLFTNIEDGSARQNFAGAMTSVDRSLGKVVEALERNGMLKNTIIMFATDNGAARPPTFSENGGSNYPLRGGKNTLWEGGLRGPAFIWDGQHRFKCSVYNGLMHVVDWLPTLYAAAGGSQNLAQEFGIDGLNMWSSILSDGPSPRQCVLLQADPISNLTAYRSGDFKLISGQPLEYWDNNNNFSYVGRGPPPLGFPVTSSLTKHVLRRAFGGRIRVHGPPVRVDCGITAPETDPCDPAAEACLFNIREDPCEQRNLAKLWPHTLKRLQTEIGRLTITPPSFPLLDYNANPDFWGGFWTHWEDYPRAVNESNCT